MVQQHVKSFHVRTELDNLLKARSMVRKTHCLTKQARPSDELLLGLLARAAHKH